MWPYFIAGRKNKSYLFQLFLSKIWANVGYFSRFSPVLCIADRKFDEYLCVFHFSRDSFFFFFFGLMTFALIYWTGGNLYIQYRFHSFRFYERLAKSIVNLNHKILRSLLFGVLDLSVFFFFLLSKRVYTRFIYLLIELFFFK